MPAPIKAETRKAGSQRTAEQSSEPERASLRQSASPLHDILTLSRPTPPNGGPNQTRAILNLQRTIGNRATGRLLRRLGHSVQTKLTVGEAGDMYEREADAAADRVTAGQPVERLSRLPAAGLSQRARRQVEPEEEEPVQTYPVQRQVTEEEAPTETPVGGQLVQRMCPACEEKARRQVDEEPEEVEAAPVRAQAIEDEEPVQMQAAEEEEKETPVQTQAQGGGSGIDTAAAERSMARSGSGNPLGGHLQTRMEASFGTDFSGVRVHTGPAAREANRAINARAFTHGSDIYLGHGESATDTRLMAHELTHVVQQSGTVLQPATNGELGSTNADEPSARGITRSASPASTPASRDVVYRWGSEEHMRLGDVTGRRIDIGGGVELTFGQVVALAGDEFGSLEELTKATQTARGRAMIRAHLERASIPGVAAAKLPEPTAEERKQAGSEYILLALENISHFVGGGTAVENWIEKHTEAIDLAIQSGVYKDASLLNQANMTEAFGGHFLTDAFSSGHIRVPRDEITAYYVDEFAPAVFDHLIDHLRERLIDEIYDQIDEQTVLNEAAYIGGLLGGLGARAYIRGEIESDINSRLNELFTKSRWSAAGRSLSRSRHRRDRRGRHARHGERGRALGRQRHSSDPMARLRGRPIGQEPRASATGGRGGAGVRSGFADRV